MARPRSTPRHWLAIALALDALMLLICLVLTAMHGLGIVDQAKAARASLHVLVADASGLGPGLDRAQLDRIRGEFDQVRGDFEGLAATMASDPLVAILRHLPVADRQVAGADRLVAAGQDLVEAADALLPTAQGYVTAREQHQVDPAAHPQLAALATLMAQSAPGAAHAQALVADAQVQLAAIPTGLMGQIEDVRGLMLTELGKYGPFLDSYVQASQVLPGVLGVGGEKRYLVLAEDSAELRPTGGFVGTYGVMAFQEGRIVQKGFQDVYLLDRKPGLPYVAPPAALARHLLTPPLSWQLRDSNWSPDFPTAAQEALRLYSLESGDTKVDGVLAMTTLGMDSLLRITGPITVPEYGVTVQPGQTAVVLLQHTRVSPTPGVNRKAFVADFADEVMARLLETPPAQWPKLIDVLGTMGRERQTLVWLRDPSAEALVRHYGWDGSVSTGPGDYLYVVDANVSPSGKLNAVTDRAASLSVQLNADGTATETLQLSWHNHYTPNGILAGVQPADRPNLGDYVRLLLPQGSKVSGPSGGRPWPVRAAYAKPETVVTTEAGRLSWGHYQQVAPGTSTLTWRWTTPVVAVTSGGRVEYRLLVQKQPGTGPDSLTVRVALPPGATLTSSSPGLSVSGPTVTLKTVMDGDQVIELWYTPPPAVSG